MCLQLCDLVVGRGWREGAEVEGRRFLGWGNDPAMTTTWHHASVSPHGSVQHRASSHVSEGPWLKMHHCRSVYCNRYAPPRRGVNDRDREVWGAGEGTIWAPPVLPAWPSFKPRSTLKTWSIFKILSYMSCSLTRCN